MSSAKAVLDELEPHCQVCARNRRRFHATIYVLCKFESCLMSVSVTPPLAQGGTFCEDVVHLYYRLLFFSLQYV